MAMAMPISLHALPTTTTTTLFKPISSVGSSRSRRASHVASARKGLSSRTRRSERKKGGATSTPTKEEEAEAEAAAAAAAAYVDIGGGGGGGGGGEIEYSTAPMPKLEGLEPDFWEGPKWNALGFFLQYMWAFGILFGLVACGVAVSTYNEGATDFKKTPVYQESIQSRDLLEEPEASNSDVFEANPTEVAPSLE
ncbi:uncharacterized protein M6B38_277130 [Iris pallida]|uniref:Uncharacterized protein n=1 Tax=Iris pallida TaxID=29817 RepID=A0AAX6I3M9_IRIPA|nr:uncharacterized protein M6B38_277130 [Iris pallida]